MDRPKAVCNRSISNCNSDSSDSFSASTLSSRFSHNTSTRSKADSSHSYVKKRSRRTTTTTTTTKLDNNTTATATAMHNVSPIQRDNSNDDLEARPALTLHTSDSDFSKQRKAKARAGLDRQHSISRWMADTVSMQCGKIRRAVSSHEKTTLNVSLSTATDATEYPQLDSTNSSFHNETADTITINAANTNTTVNGNVNTNTNTNTTTDDVNTAIHTKIRRDTANNTKSAPFRLFRKVNSNISLSKPVRKRSYGSEGLLKDVLAALSGHSESKSRPGSRSSSVRVVPFWGMDSNPDQHLDANDIEEDEEDDEGSACGEGVEFFSEETNTGSTNADNDTPTLSTTPTDKANSSPPLLKGRLRWDASSPFQKERKQQDVPPSDRLPRCYNNNNNNNMPGIPPPPPPPFSSVNSNSNNNNNNTTDNNSRTGIPDDLFQTEYSTGPTPKLGQRNDNDKINDGAIGNPLAPLAATYAAIDIATDGIVDNDDEDEDDCLNDMVSTKQQQQQSSLMLGNSESSLQNYESTSNAASDSVISNSYRTADSWGEDSEISLDGVSMLSASNASLQFSAQRSLASISLGGNTSSVATSSTTTGGLAAYMNWVERKAEEDRKKNAHGKAVKAKMNANNHLNLGAYMNKVKEEEDHKKNHQEFRYNHLDLSYKSFAEETFDESAPTFHCDGYAGPSAKTRLNVPIKANSDHHVHPLLTTSTREASIVPPCMPQRSVSSHKREGTHLTQTTTQTTGPVESLSDRVQLLLDINQKKYKTDSLLDNTANGCNQALFQRRRSLDNGNESPDSSVPTRRASIDNSAATSGSGSKAPAPQGENLYYFDPNLSPKSRKLKIVSLQQSFLTPTMSKTPRTSPSHGVNRKRIGVQKPLGNTNNNNNCSSSSSSKPSPMILTTPKSTRPSLAASLAALPMVNRSPPIKEEESWNNSESVVAMKLQAPDGTNGWKVDVPLSSVSASR